MKVVYGSMGKSLYPGKAAMDGLLSGFLARDGFTSSTEPVEGHRGFLHGTPDNPMSDGQLEDKFVALAAPVLGSEQALELARVSWGLEQFADLAGLLELTVPQSGRSLTAVVAGSISMGD
jgi:2-methylcitrate dehydratase PrpD